MNCFCDRAFTPVAGVGQWNWGTFAQNIVQAGVQIGAQYGIHELTGSGNQQATGINPNLANPYAPQQQPVYLQQPAASGGTPDWVWPVVIGGGLLALVVVFKLR